MPNLTFVFKNRERIFTFFFSELIQILLFVLKKRLFQKVYFFFFFFKQMTCFV